MGKNEEINNADAIASGTKPILVTINVDCPQIRKQETSETEQSKTHDIYKDLMFIILSDLLANAPFLAMTKAVISLLHDQGFRMLDLGDVGQPLFATLLTLLLLYSSKVWGSQRVLLFSVLLSMLHNLALFCPINDVMLHSGTTVVSQAILICIVLLYSNNLGVFCQKSKALNIDYFVAHISAHMYVLYGVGFLITFAIVMYFDDKSTLFTDNRNSSIVETFHICGAQYCRPADNIGNVKIPLASWPRYAVLAWFAIVFSACLTSVVYPSSNSEEKTTGEKFSCTACLKSKWLWLKDPASHVIIVLSIFVGILNGSILSHYIQERISCFSCNPIDGILSLGCFGIHIVIGKVQEVLNKSYGRLFAVIYGISILKCFVIVLSFWNTNPDQVVFLLVLTVFWTSGVSIVSSMILSIHGILSGRSAENSISIGNVWIALGICISLGWNQI